MMEKTKGFIKKIPLVGVLARWSFNLLKAPQNVKALSYEVTQLREEIQNKSQIHFARMADEVKQLREEIRENSQTHFTGIVNEINRLLNTQVKHSQPIYGVPGTFFSTKSEMSCSERAKIVEKYFNGNVNNIRILDTASSLGYFCFYLADRGAFTEGWDSLELNVYVANLTKEINGISTTRFFCRRFDADSIKYISCDYYDCVLLFDVLHQTAQQYGLEYSRQLIKSLADKIPVLIVEFKKPKKEIEYGQTGNMQNNDLDFFSILVDYKIDKLGEFTIPDSDTVDSIYAVSQKYIDVNNHKYLISETLYHAHKDLTLPMPQRRFYLSNSFFIKQYFLNNPENFKQIINEINILHLLENTKISNITRLIDYELEKNSVTLVLNRINGSLLYEVLDRLSELDKLNICHKILAILCDLELLKIFHNDIRSWNIIIDSQSEPHIFDFGLSSFFERENNLIAFAFLVNSLITNIPEEKTYDKKSLPECSDSILDTKYIAPIRSGKIKTFRDLYDNNSVKPGSVLW
jgi:2-polyprenyl-3-methyl-5-hydroxy-6-metoxy-1,4-benzoquinol methylase